MNQQQNFQDFDFHPARQRISRRQITIAVSIVIFIILWNVIPSSLLFWVMFPLFIGLVWIASYGWHKAVHRLIHFMHRIENL